MAGHLRVTRHPMETNMDPEKEALEKERKCALNLRNMVLEMIGWTAIDHGSIADEMRNRAWRYVKEYEQCVGIEENISTGEKT